MIKSMSRPGRFDQAPEILAVFNPHQKRRFSKRTAVFFTLSLWTLLLLVAVLV